MNAPKTIYVHKNICSVIDGGEHASTARTDRRWDGDVEYRLVEVCQWTKEPHLPIYVEGDDISYTTQCGVSSAFKDGPFCSCGGRVELVERENER